MSKKIYVSLGIPGSGKTECFLQAARKWLCLGHKIVMAVPTHKLAGEIIDRCASMRIECEAISGEESEGRRLECLQSALSRGVPFILTTHAAILGVDGKLLEEYRLVFDELPAVINVDCKEIKKADLAALLVNLEQVNNTLKIREGRRAQVKALVSSFRSAGASTALGSACSELEFRVYSCLLDDGVALVKTFSDGDERVSIQFGNISDVFEKITFAREFHVLTATLHGGIFHTVAKAKGFLFEVSRFSPPKYQYQANVTIYPLCTQRWSKAKALRTGAGEIFFQHLGSQSQYVDEVIAVVCEHNGSRPILLFCNSWFQKASVQKYDNIEVCPPDSRGMNGYATYTAAMLIYSGQVSPNHKPVLYALEEKLGMVRGELIEAWRVTNKFERALQDITRTAIRMRGTSAQVELYVQDDEVCDFLVATCLPRARLDWSLMTQPPVIKKAPSITAERDTLSKEIVSKGLRDGANRKVIVQELMAAGLSQTTAYDKYKKYGQQCC